MWSNSEANCLRNDTIDSMESGANLRFCRVTYSSRLGEAPAPTTSWLATFRSSRADTAKARASAATAVAACTGDTRSTMPTACSRSYTILPARAIPDVF